MHGPSLGRVREGVVWLEHRALVAVLKAWGQTWESASVSWDLLNEGMLPSCVSRTSLRMSMPTSLNVGGHRQATQAAKRQPDVACPRGPTC